MVNRVSAAEAKAKLPELVARVAYGGEKYIIERRGKPLAALVAVEDLEQLERGSGGERRRDGALALLGAWEEVPDNQIEAIFADVVASRAAQPSRLVPPLG